MALDPVVNFFRSTIATLPVASGGTSIVLQTGDGNKLPAPAIDGAFNLTIYNADDPFVAPEIVRVTARSGDTLTVTRAQEGTSATNKTSGSTWNVELTPTAKTIQDIDSAKLDVAGGTMTGDLTIPDKIIHSGDTNTAIRFPANDTVAIETAGVERFRVGSTGNVGIGTTTPSSMLSIIDSVISSGTTTQYFFIRREGGTSFGISLTYNDAGVGEVLYDATASGLSGSAHHIWRTRHNFGSTTERMRITSAGNVGIGTTTPATALDVNGDVTITDKIIHSGDTNTAIRFPSADTVTIETNGSEAFRVGSNQRVSLGTTTANQTVTLANNVQIGTGFITGSVQKTLTSGVSNDLFSIQPLNTANSTLNGYIKVIFGIFINNAGVIFQEAGEFVINYRTDTGTNAITKTVSVVASGTPSTALSATFDTAINKITISLDAITFTTHSFTYAIQHIGTNMGCTITYL